MRPTSRITHRWSSNSISQPLPQTQFSPEKPPKKNQKLILSAAKSKRIILAKLILPTLLLPLLFACKSSPNSSSTSAPTTLRIAYPDEPRRIDPAFSKDLYEGIVSGFLYDGLVGFGPGAEIEPRLADSWTTTPDSLHYNFHLRENAKFLNGAPLRSADVRYTFERLLHPTTNSDRRWVLDAVDGAAEFTSGTTPHLRGLSLPDGPDGRRIEITLSRPSPTFLTLLAMPAASVIAENSGGPIGAKPDGASDRDPSRRVIGTGPWVMSRWESQRSLEFTPNSHFWGARPRLERLIYTVQTDDTVRRRQFEIGNLDIYQVGFQAWQQYSNAATIPRHARLESVQELRTDFIGINCSKPALRDPGVRQAIASAIDAPTIFEKLQKRRGVVAVGPLPPGVPGYREGRQPRRYDPAHARELLKSAGAPTPLRIQIWYRDESLNSEIADAAKTQLAAAGIEATPVTRDQSAFREAIWAGAPDLFLGSWTLDYPDPEAALGPPFLSRNIPRQGNQAHYSDPETDRQIESAMSETNPAARITKWQQVEDRLIDQVPWIPLFHRKNYYAVAPDVKDFTPALMYNTDRYLTVHKQ